MLPLQRASLVHGSGRLSKQVRSSFLPNVLLSVAKSGSAYYNLGYNSLVSWSVSADGKVILIYESVERQTIVNLQCSTELDQMVVNGEYEQRRYNLTLISKCACWNGC